MGTVYTNDIKRIAERLYQEHEAEVTSVYKDNQKLVKMYVDVSSKKVRNRIAGYLTRYSKLKQRVINEGIEESEDMEMENA